MRWCADGKAQTASYTAENVLDEDGSFKLEVDGAEDRSVSYHSAGGLKLSDDLDTEIGFTERPATAKASFQLRLSGTTGGEFTDTIGFTTLVWFPGVTAPDTADGAVHANLQDGEWWSAQNVDGAKDFARVSLEAIAAAQPNAVVDPYGVSIGRGSAATLHSRRCGDVQRLHHQLRREGCRARNQRRLTWSPAAAYSTDPAVVLGRLSTTWRVIGG